MEQTGLIDLTELFNSISKTLRQPLYSPVLAFYNISRKIEKNLKFSSLEFIYKNNLSLDQELNINEFLTFISEPLHLDDITSKNVFKCLDFNQKGKIFVSDFILVVDSYRQDYMENILNSEKIEEKKEDFKESPGNKDPKNIDNAADGIIGVEISNKFKLKDSQIYWINKFMQISESVGLTPYMIFSISANEKNLKEMYLENLKKKLKIVIPTSKISAAEITHIADSFDINQKSLISFDDYTEMIEVCKMDPIFSNNLSSNFEHNLNLNYFPNKKDEILLKKLRIKNKNVHLLPVRGNTRVLNHIKNILYSKINNNTTTKNIKNNTNPDTEENKDEGNAAYDNKNYNKLETYNSNCLENENYDLEKIKSEINSEENKSKFNHKLNLLNRNFIKNFSKELEVFENGEWYFIDIIEDISIEKNAIPVFGIYNSLVLKICPTIARKNTFNIIKIIDEDMDGYITYKDLMVFLLENFNHTSFKLAIKEMARVIEIEAGQIPTIEYFRKNLIKEFDELNSINFIQVIIKLFKLPQLIVKKIYYELKQLTKKDCITSKILIDLIDEYRDKNYFYAENKKSQMDRNSNLKNFKNLNFTSVVDKTFFDSEMKKLVKYLQKCFACIKIDYYNLNRIQCSLFKENLIKFLDLPIKFSLMQYRENFINSLNVNLSIGITLFNEIKNMQNISNLGSLLNKNNNLNKSYSKTFNSYNNSGNYNTTITRDDLITFIISYYDPKIIYFDLETVVNLIERNYSPIKFCFENIEYNPKGLVVIELINIFEKYYPRIAKQIIIELVKNIDSEKKGVLNYRNIITFLIKYSKNYKFSTDLFFKEISAIIDRTNLPTFQYFLKESNFSNINQLNDKVYYFEHNAFFFEKLKFNFDLSDQIFVYLSEIKLDKLNNSLSYRGNDNYFEEEEGYSFDKLIKNIDFYRAKIPSNRKILSKKINKIIDNSNQIEKVSQEINRLQNFFNGLNEDKSLDTVFDNLYLSNNSQISIFELFKLLQKTYFNKVSNDSLMKIIKILDYEKKGLIKYEKFYKIIKINSLIEIHHLSDLHMKYIANNALKQYKGNLEAFLNFKNLTKHLFVSLEEFKNKFGPEFFKDEVLINSIFEKLKENKGKFENTLNMQVFIDYLNFLNSSKRESCLYLWENNIQKEINNNNNTDFENMIISILKNLEEDFINIFLDYVDFKEASILGKISPENFTKIIQNNFIEKFLIQDIKALFSMFETVDKKFNLIKFIEWYEKKFCRFSVDKIIQKANENVPTNISKKLFFERHNINSYRALNLYEFHIYSNALFEFTRYETVLIFSSLLESENNPTSNEFKCSFDLFFNDFKLQNLFKVEDNDNDFLSKTKKFNEEKKLDKYVLLTLFKFANFLENLKSKIDLFKNYDADTDGILNRNEFEKMLVKCTLYGMSLNEMQITTIINLADKNGDGIINYIEFMDFLDDVKNNFSEKYQKNFNFKNYNIDGKLDINKAVYNYSDISAVRNISTNYDLSSLQKNYEFNLQNFLSFEKHKIHSQRILFKKGKINLSETCNEKQEKIFKLLIFYFQEEFIDDLNKFLYQVSLIDNIETDIIPYNSLYEILLKMNKPSEYLNEDIKERLFNFSIEGLKVSEKNKMLLENTINIKNLILNIFKFRVVSGDGISSKNPSFKQTNLELGIEAQNEMLKNTILDCLATKKKFSRRTLRREKDFTNIKDNKYNRNSEEMNQIIKKTKITCFPNNSKSNQIREKIKKDRENYEINTNNKFQQIQNDLYDEEIPVNKNEQDSYDNDPLYNPTQKSSTFLSKFKEVADKIASNEYEYKINSETDYFKRPDGRIVETILNCEEAAIKKCELIFNSIKDNEKFFDKDFGSQPHDNDNCNKFSLYTKGVQPRGAYAPSQIDWYRMKEISPNQEPKFITEGADSNDVIQGALGDCWFISALSVLATKDHLLRGEFNEGILDDGIIDEEENLMLSTGVYPPIFHCFRVKNIFCFKFFKDFGWRWVIIDDRLPCRKISANQLPRLIYSRCKAENEFWVPLIEKAYAKLHGNYEALISGFIDEGLVDLTGFTARKINITNDTVKTPQKADELWNILNEYSCIEYDKTITKKDRNGRAIKSNILRINNSMMGVSIDAKTVEMDVVYNNQKCGLLARHAYSILDTIEIPKPNSYKARKKSRLLRIRNPWGTKEWKGKWSDDSQEIANNRES